MTTTSQSSAAAGLSAFAGAPALDMARHYATIAR